MKPDEGLPFTSTFFKTILQLLYFRIMVNQVVKPADYEIDSHYLTLTLPSHG